MAGLPRDRRKHSLPQLRVHDRAVHPAAREYFLELARDRQLQWHPVLPSDSLRNRRSQTRAIRFCTRKEFQLINAASFEQGRLVESVTEDPW